ncbi:MAG: gamma-glutamyl-gamma-aminobutyrate hydrolase family protein [Oligoflexales bacterium]
MKMSIILIDHYDSFTANLRDWLSCEFHVQTYQYDRMPSASCLPCSPIVLSPGRKDPQSAPQTCDLVFEKHQQVPLLGVCLGHQILGHCFGSQIQCSRNPVHGEVKNFEQQGKDPLFEGFGKEFSGAAYHSLVVENVPQGWEQLATCEYGEVQAMRSPGVLGAFSYGIQFHPESFMTLDGERILQNWKKIVLQWKAAQA